MFEACLRGRAKVIEIDLVYCTLKIEIYPIDLGGIIGTSCSFRVLPTPLPDALLKNMKMTVYYFIFLANI